MRELSRVICVGMLMVVMVACTGLPPTAEMTPLVGVTAIAPTQTDTLAFPIIHTPAQPTATQIRCGDAPQQRLVVFERGRVTDDDDETLNLRAGSGVNFDILTRLEPGELFFVLEGPVCSGGFLWFRVQAGAIVGWLAEGDDESYYTEPYLTG